MSLILEALKKSENKRRLGETPNLGTPLMHAPRRRNFLPLILCLIVVAAGASWWVFYRPGINLSTSSKVADSTLTKSLTAVSAPLAATKPASPPANSSAISTTSTPQPTVPNTVTSAARGQPTSAISTSTTAAMPPAPTYSTPSPATATTLPPTTAPTLTPTPAASSIASPPTTATKPSVAAANSSSSLPFYYQLAYALRKDLPPIKISMHVFTDDPAQRFVIINGTRQVEGDKLGTDLNLSEIRPNEVVIEFRNERFIVPRNGM